MALCKQQRRGMGRFCDAWRDRRRRLPKCGEPLLCAVWMGLYPVGSRGAAAFRASAERCAPSEYKLHRAVLLSDYPNIAPDAISAEKAAELGAQAIGFPNAVVDCTAYIGSSPHPIWKVTYRVDFGDGSCTYWFVEVDSITGAVLGVAEKVGGHLFRSIVLDRVYDEVIHWVDDRPGAG